MIDKNKLDDELLEKIKKRSEFKIRIDTLTVWDVAVKDSDDFRMLISALRNYCKDMTWPDFSKAKDKKLLEQLFKMEAAKQGNSAIAYAKMCIKNTHSGKKGGQATAKRTQASAKRTEADNDNDIDNDFGSDIDIEDIDIDIDNDRSTSPCLSAGLSPEEDRKLPPNFWGEENV